MQRIDRATVAGEVRANLARQGKTQGWLAQQIKITPATLSRRLSLRSSFSLDELSAIATALDIPLAVLLPEPVTA